MDVVGANAVAALTRNFGNKGSGLAFTKDEEEHLF
jgi:hypothetical protein